MAITIEGLMSNLRLRLPEYLQLKGSIADPFKKFRCINVNHEDSSPSMNVHRDGTFAKCFSCNLALDIFTAAHFLENKPISGEAFLTENVFYLADLFKLDRTKLISSKSKDNINYAMKYAYNRACRVISDYLQEVSYNSPQDLYEREVRRRKWKPKESISLGIVCCDSFKNLVSVLNSNGFTDNVINDIGLWRADIFSPDNLIFTIFDEYNNPIAFYSRDVRYEEKKLAYEKKDFSGEIVKEKAPIKYNSIKNMIGLYEKKLYPYGIHDIKNFHKVIAVEGHGCRHSLKLNGIPNCIALGGLELSNETLDKLSAFGVTNIVLLLDNDKNGLSKIKEIIKQYYGKNNIELSVMDITDYSDVKDPDELIRKHGPESFQKLKEVNVIEWLALRSISELQDSYESAKEIASLISFERSPVNRAKLISSISYILDIDSRIISEEVDQLISTSKDRKSEYALKVLEEAKDCIRHNSDSIEAAMNMIDVKLKDINKDNTSEDSFSSKECLKGLMALKEVEESEDADPVIKTGFRIWDKVCPIPTSEAFCLLVGPPNAGKSGLILTLAVNILNSNDDTIVVMYTNDDSRDVYYSRLIAIISGIQYGWIKMPNHFLDDDKKLAREAAYIKLKEWINEDRLIIKDVTHGNSVEYYGNLLKHYREKYPNKSIFSTCDNLHRVPTEIGLEDQRTKIKYVSGLIKEYTIKYNIAALCSVEMTKYGMYEEHVTPESISETASLQYDANLILFIWNEVNAKKEEAILYFERDCLDYNSEDGYVIYKKISPIIKLNFVKSKLSSFKGSLYFKFYDEMLTLEEISQLEAEQIINNNKPEESPKRKSN